MKATKIHCKIKKITNNKNLEAMVNSNTRVGEAVVEQNVIANNPISQLSQVEIRKHLNNRSNPAYEHYAEIAKLEKYAEEGILTVDQCWALLSDDTIALCHLPKNKNLTFDQISLVINYKIIDRLKEKLDNNVDFFSNLAKLPNVTAKQLKRIVSMAVPMLAHDGCLEVIRCVIWNDKCTESVLKDSISHDYIMILRKEDKMKERLERFNPYKTKPN